MTKTYYAGTHAAHYNRVWGGFSDKTLTETMERIAAIDCAASQGRAKPLRVLDVACGTGLLLHRLAQQFPEAELYGVDASGEMLAQAQQLLRDETDGQRIHLLEAMLNGEEKAGLPYERQSFDVITCTNTLHYFAEPVATLRGIRQLIAPDGHCIIEDYARWPRSLSLPWAVFEWGIKRADPQHVRAYTLVEAQTMCQQVGLSVKFSKKFYIDLLCRGWVLSTTFAQV